MAKKQSKKAAKKSTKKAAAKESDNSKVCAILQYFFPIGQIWYLVDDEMKNDKRVKFHLKQSLVLVLTSVALNIVFSILPFLYFIAWILQLGLFVLWVIGLINAIKDEEKDVPLIGQLAKHFTF